MINLLLLANFIKTAWWYDSDSDETREGDTSGDNSDDNKNQYCLHVA